MLHKFEITKVRKGFVHGCHCSVNDDKLSIQWLAICNNSCTKELQHITINQKRIDLYQTGNTLEIAYYFLRFSITMNILQCLTTIS